MKIIATTNTGYIAELSQIEAVRLTGLSNIKNGDEANPLGIINKANFINTEIAKLTQLEASLKSAGEKVAALVTAQKEDTKNG